MKYTLVGELGRNRAGVVSYSSNSYQIECSLVNPNLIKKIDEDSSATNFLMESSKLTGKRLEFNRFSLGQKPLYELKSDFELQNGSSNLHNFAYEIVIRCAEILHLMEVGKIGYSYIHPSNLFGESSQDLRIALRMKKEEIVSFDSSTPINLIKSLFLWSLISPSLLEKDDREYSDLSLKELVGIADSDENASLNENARPTLDTYYDDFIKDDKKSFKCAKDIFDLFNANKEYEEIVSYSEGKEVERVEQVEIIPIVDEPPIVHKHEDANPNSKKKISLKKPILIAIGVVLLGGLAFYGYNLSQSKPKEDKTAKVKSEKIDISKMNRYSSEGNYNQAANLAEKVSDLSVYNADDQKLIVLSLLKDYRYEKAIKLSSKDETDTSTAQIFLSLESDTQKKGFENMKFSSPLADALKNSLKNDFSYFDQIPSKFYSETVYNAIATAYANNDKKSEDVKKFIIKHGDSKNSFVNIYKLKDKKLEL